MICLLLGSVNYLYILPAREVSIGFQVIKQGIKGVQSWETHPEPMRAVTVRLTFLKSHLLHNTCCAQVKCRQRQSTTSEKHKNNYENPSLLASGTWTDTSTACAVLRGATTVSGSMEQAWRFLWSITGQETVQASLRSVSTNNSECRFTSLGKNGCYSTVIFRPRSVMQQSYVNGATGSSVTNPIKVISDQTFNQLRNCQSCGA